MSKLDELHGASAFERGVKRSENPHDINAPEWMDWMDGFDQARVNAELQGEKGDTKAA